MATSYTTNLKMQLPAVGDNGFSPLILGDFDELDALAPVGGLAVTYHEGGASTTLLVDVAAGNYVKQDGSVGVYAGTTSFALTASNTNYIYLDGTSSYALTKSTSTFPATAHVRLATVVAGGTTLTSNADSRLCFPVCGTIVDGINWTFGTSTGTKIGTATGQKIGFFNKTPITQPTMGSATAGGTYTSAEQAMLQAVYDAVRNLGLGS